MSIILAFALAASIPGPTGHTVWVDTPCASHILSHCVVEETRFGPYGNVADVNVSCKIMDSVPQVPGWTIPEHPSERPLDRLSRLGVNSDAIVFSQCDVSLYENLTHGGWQQWECLSDPVCK